MPLRVPQNFTHAEMRRRLRSITDLCGQRNAWNAGGPTEDLPLLVTVIDECQTYLDLGQHEATVPWKASPAAASP